MSAGGDLLFPGVPGRRTLKIRLLGAYLSRLHAAAEGDADLATAFMRVAGLVAPPQSLLSPGIADASCGEAALVVGTQRAHRRGARDQQTGNEIAPFLTHREHPL